MSRYVLAALVAACAIATAAPAVASAGAGHRHDPAHLPNLVSVAPQVVVIGQADDRSGPALRFNYATANVGAAPLDIMAEVTGEELAPAHQCVRWAAPRVCLAREEVGGIQWHEPHGHFHFEDYAQYELRRVDASGRPVMDDDGLVRTSEKISFCLIDSDKHSEADPAYATPFYVSCIARAGWQGITPGYQDIYHYGRTGQQIPLTGIDDGVYALVFTVDPDGLLFESDRSDNTSHALVRIRNGTVRIVEAP
ncbi:MAG TPA: lysyl oxidase family protein [Egibacteraceae bacterium]|nr:lysyl oxidase family protein [Egibacteraceae bacterium]